MQHGYQSSEKMELLVCQHPPWSSLPCHTHLSWQAHMYIWRYIQDRMWACYTSLYSAMTIDFTLVVVVVWHEQQSLITPWHSLYSDNQHCQYDKSTPLYSVNTVLMYMASSETLIYVAAPHHRAYHGFC